MNKKRCLFSILCVCFSFFCFLFISLSKNNTKEIPNIEMYYFHETICGSCDGTTEFIDIFQTQLKDVKSDYPYSLKMFNVFQTDSKNIYQRILNEYNISPEAITLPVLLINGKPICGLDNIEKNIKETYLSAREIITASKDPSFLAASTDSEHLFTDFSVSSEDSVVLYFYRLTCEECENTTPIIDSLPEEIMAKGKLSNIRLFRFNTRVGSNIERIQKLFEEYHVPAEEQQVPIIFLSDTYLSGYSNISQFITEELEAGKGLSFTFPTP